MKARILSFNEQYQYELKNMKIANTKNLIPTNNNSTNSRKRSQVEWYNKMVQQLRFLKDFCDKYDEGLTEYAIQISALLRTLLHSGSNKSLLENFCDNHNININKPLFADSATYDMNMKKEEDSEFVRVNLCSYRLIIRDNQKENEFYAIPRTEFKVLRKKDFESWWEKETVISLGNPEIVNDDNEKEKFEFNKMTRKTTVLAICNKEGGAHIDKNIPYHLQLLNDNLANALTINNTNVKTKLKLDTVYYATIRQIASEVLYTLVFLVNEIYDKFYL